MILNSLNINFLLSNSRESIPLWFCASEEHVDPYTHAAPERCDAPKAVWELSDKLPVQQPTSGKNTLRHTQIISWLSIERILWDCNRFLCFTNRWMSNGVTEEDNGGLANYKKKEYIEV